jgi:murein DD-endopeptidase MepM/ murein hydrolase activator NlpD
MKPEWKQGLKKLFAQAVWWAISLFIILSFAFPAWADGESVEAEVMEMSFADMGPLKTGGSIPSFRDSIYSTEGEAGLLEFDTALTENEQALVYNPAREWFEGQYPADVVKVGDLMGTNIGVEALTLDYLSQNSNIDLLGARLGEVSFLQGVTVNDLIGNVPYLGDFKVSDMGGFAGATGLEGFDGSVIEAVREVPDIGELLVTDGALGEVAVADIPNLATTPIGTIPGVGDNVISNVPGLENLDFGKYPGFDLAKGLIPVAKQDIVFGKTEYSGDIETPNPVSGGTDGTKLWKPIACSGGCPHLELMDADISPVKGAWTGANWMTREHRVKDGWGILGAMFGEAGAYRVPFGDVFALQVTKTDEKTATAEWGLAFRVCSNGIIDMGCTAYFLEVDLPITTSEKATILTGLNDDKGGASQPMDAPPGWEALRPASPAELQAMVAGNTARRSGGFGLCGDGPGGVSFESLAGAFAGIEGNYSSVGAYTNGGYGLGRYQYMTYREDVQASIKAKPGGQAFLDRAAVGAPLSEAEVDQYFPAADQDAIFKADQTRNIEQAMSEGMMGSRIVERVGQIHYGGTEAPIDGNWADLHGRLTLKTYGEELAASYAEAEKTNEKGKKCTAPTPVQPLQTHRTGTLAAQEYGASRDGGARTHAGQDIDIDSDGTFQSYIGGKVVSSGYDEGGYYAYVDIYNEDLGVVERIAELDNIHVPVGSTVQAGQVIGQGTSATGVVHLEYRPVGSDGVAGYGFQGTEDPIAYLENIGVVQRQGEMIVPIVDTAPRPTTTPAAIAPATP